jgi:hypothetical protein
MRRTIAGVLCLLVLTATGGGAAANPSGGAEAVMGASAAWWRHGATHGTLYYLDVYDFAGTWTNRVTAYRGYFVGIPCEVGKKNRATDCKWRRADVQRVTVDSFEADPLMNSAHAVVHRGNKRGEITWTGRGDYSRPFLWESIGQTFFPPYFGHIYAHVLAMTGRNATARGDLFGLGLKRGEFRGAGLFDMVYASGGACLTGPWCFAEG